MMSVSVLLAGGRGCDEDGLAPLLLIVSLVLASVLSLLVWLVIGARWFGPDH